MSRIKIKTKAQNTLFCIMFTLRRSQNYSQWSIPSQNKQAFKCLSYPWLASLSGVYFLQLSDTDAPLRTYSWPWLKICNTPSALNYVILCLYWAFHLVLKPFTFSWRETLRQHRPGNWKSCSFTWLDVSKVWDLFFHIGFIAWQWKRSTYKVLRLWKNKR